jgi:predicted DNA-binding transcriptional regulator AlpA
MAEKGDRRALSRMDAETKLIHHRLEAWADWARHDDPRPWPASTLMARTIEFGKYGVRSAGRPPTEMPDSVAHVDAAIAHLGEIDRRVVTTYYTRWAPQEVMARSINMRRNKFDAALRRARWRIWAFLKAIEHLSANSIPHTVTACKKTAPPSAGLFFGPDSPLSDIVATGVSMDPSASARSAERAQDRPIVLWPSDVEQRYRISDSTRSRWEKTGKLPPRDVHLGGEAVAWYATTIEGAERRPAMAVG